MAINKNKKTSTGIFITEESLYFAQVSQIKEELFIDKLRVVTAPNRAFNNGKIKDQDTLANQIIRVLGDDGFHTSQIVVAFSDIDFIKHIERFSNVSDFELKDLIADKIAAAYSFIQEEITFGYQRLPLHINRNYSENIDILFALSEKNKITTIQEMFDAMGITLLAIDIECLAVLRTVASNNYLANTEALCIYITDDFIDINILFNGEVVFTHAIKKNLDKIRSNFMGLDELMLKIKNVVLSYENKYPTSELHKMVVISTVKFLTDITEKLQEHFPGFDRDQYQLMETNFRNINKILKDEVLANSLNEFVPAIGLALKAFEPHNQTLSLIKVRRQMEPVIRPFELILTSIAILLLGLGFIISSFFLTSKSRVIENKIENTKTEIHAYSTGEYIQRQQKLQSIQAEIASYTKYRTDFVKTGDIILKITQDLPDDIVFDTISIDQNLTDTKGSISGTSILMGSLYAFVKQLNMVFQDVEIQELKYTYLSNEFTFPSVKFQMKFKTGLTSP